ncbi:glycoside hydrolase family 66 protein [Actinacidiphila soli]|uniref:glycoside hydrolase family 66 protein n=1 Tax=Actinacidiphila soli TaxID=2487275 RepID=UPI000FCC4728|nr:glycoside hydrolase family 66 protein [Actinacidiphila soli]
MTELLPERTVYVPGAPVRVEVRGSAGPGTVTVRHLGRVMAETSVDGDGFADLGALPVGGYGVELVTADRTVARTAVQVAGDPRSALRYGFVVDYRPGRDIGAVTDNLRRLHLTAVQLYDWAYRHADLLGGGQTYQDALGQPVALDTVRALIEGCHHVGSDALGYAAVYAVGPKEWPGWEHDALLTPSGEPYGLGDFLFLVDPAAGDWLDHFTGDLADAVDRVGFDGFHLDQYGYPKRAYRPDGTPVDMAAGFTTMIGRIRGELPTARLVFNNVNDFPTWATARTPQDAVYIEVWEPSTGLEHLAQIATRARADAAGNPVVIAAYQHVYDSAPAAASDLATALTMATLHSHGATHLLCGEADRILVDPYYVRNHVVEASTAALLHRWYDFLVEHVELLTAPGIADVTASYAGGYNDDLDVSYAATAVGHPVAPGRVWRRITQVGDRLVVHLINLAGQDDTLWDAPRSTPADPGPGTLRIRKTGPGLPRVRVADPDRQPHLVDIPVTDDGDYAHATLPAPHLWQIVVIDPVSGNR